jgi:hypothetical protein
MASAWMFFAVTGIVFARYYKFLFPDFKIFGLAFWFNVHRPVMIFVSLVSVAAFILILKDLEWKWINYSTAPKITYTHSICGILVICLAFLQANYNLKIIYLIIHNKDQTFKNRSLPLSFESSQTILSDLFSTGFTARLE